MIEKGRELPNWARWLVVPVVLLVLVLVALAVGAESPDSFVTRQQERTSQSSGDELQPFEGGVDTSRLIIETEHGPVELSMDGNEVGGRTAATGGSVLGLRLDPDGNIVGFKVDDDGNFVAVQEGESLDGVTLLSPQPDGSLELRLPDGTVIELDQDSRGLTATVDGEETALYSEDGSVRFGDLVATPVQPGQPSQFDNFGEPPAPESAPPEANPETSNPDANWFQVALVVTGVLAAVVISILALIAYRKRRQPKEEVTGPSLVPVRSNRDPWSSFLEFVETLRQNPDTNEAVRLAFGYVEQGVGTIPARQMDDTPIEWLRRADAADPGAAKPLRVLVDRYLDVRFGGTTTTSGERDEAVDALVATVNRTLDPDSRRDLSSSVGLT